MADTHCKEMSLEEALSEGAMDHLPPNQPKGLLGERGLNLYKTDTFEPDLNAGVSQENDGPVIHLAIILAYLLFFPLGFWLLWRSRIYTLKAKIALTIIGTIGVLWVSWFILFR